MTKHDHTIMKVALGVAIAICLLLFIWLMVLLVGLDEQELRDSTESETEQLEGEQENDEDDTSSEADEVSNDEDSEEDPVDTIGDDENPLDKPEDDEPDSAQTSNTWVTMDGMIGLTTQSGQSAILGSNGEVIVTEQGQTSPLEISKRLLQTGEFETQQQAYERVRDEMLSEIISTGTCRRTLIDGQSAECFTIIQNHVNKSAYFVQIDRYVIMIAAYGTSGSTLVNAIDWYPSQAFKAEAQIIIGYN